MPDTADGTSVVLSWVRWHLLVGFSHLFLFFDLPATELTEPTDAARDDPAAAAAEVAAASVAAAALPPRTGLPNHGAARAVAREFPPSAVTTMAGRAPALMAWQAQHCPSWRALGAYAPGEVPARQCLNAEVAAALCPAQACAWLLHLDVDELFFTGPPDAAQGGALPQARYHQRAHTKGGRERVEIGRARQRERAERERDRGAGYPIIGS